MRRSLRVSLNEGDAGYLSEDEEGRTSFRFLDSYLQLVQRPVLSQSFEDNLSRVFRGKRNEIPTFFANLIPEGQMRDVIERSLQVAPGDDLALLAAVGQDLPGAVTISADADSIDGFEDDGSENGLDGLDEAAADETALRFSLAGVQLKFSVLREAEKLAIPAHGQRGKWIVKLDSTRFPELAANEFATLEWARAAGFDVPECHLQNVSSLAPALQAFAAPETKVLVIHRYDRSGSDRIHQEDFAQVVGLPPRLKYDQISYEQCAALALQIVGRDAYFEFVRRLAFVVASGNTDAHLKNWSLIYPDGINARLSPLYDQVFTLAWEDVSRNLALKLGGTRHLLRIDESSFGRLAEKADMDAGQTLTGLRTALNEIAEAWESGAVRRLMPPGHVAALAAYWAEAPLLKRFANVIR